MISPVQGNPLFVPNYRGRNNLEAAQATMAASFAALLPSAETLVNKTSSTGDSFSRTSPIQATSTQVETIKSEFRNWLAQPANDDRRRALGKDAVAFEALIDKASAQNAYNDPQAFVQSLSSSELSTLQHVHDLVSPIVPASLSKEGALNLLLAPGSAQDIDHDGYQSVGIGKEWQFPPVNAPASVKQAWEKSTANLSGGEKIALMGSFMPVPFDANGNAVDSASMSPDADYAALVKQTIEGIKLNQSYDQPWQREARDKQIAGLEAFLNNLQTV
jgi:hypothetical protein